MKVLFQRLHSRLGDFWWYSLLIFVAARAADCLNVFVGLWLVPKYVQPSELGAVMPLTQFANFLAIPVAVFASTFRQELTDLSQRRQFGKMKTLMRSVFISAAALLFLAIIVSRFILPQFLERIRIAEGSLGIAILFASFIGTVSPIYTNALQSLKKFKINAINQFLGAPVRLLAMIAAMPLRALTGYFVGQAAPYAFSIGISVFALRKELSVKAQPYWTRSVFSRLSKTFLIFGVCAIAGGFAQLVENTVLRQRLPEIESAAYYLVTRFSEIANFLGNAFVFTIFPFAADIASKGQDTRPLIIKSAVAVLITNSMIAGAFAIFGTQVISFIPNGSPYVIYWWAIPWTIGITTLSMISSLWTTGEIAANRFAFMKWLIPLYVIYAMTMLSVTGYKYFTNILPDSLMSFLDAHNITSLDTMLMWMSVYSIMKLIGCIIWATAYRRTNLEHNRQLAK